MPRILYLHGFASSPASAKIGLLRPMLEPHGIELTTPDLNVPSFERLDWNALVAHAVRQGEAIAPAAVVGSSLGALVALETVRRGVVAPLVLIAPALGISDQWLQWIPEGDPIVVPNHARNADAPIHRAFFEQMSRVDVDREPPPARVTVIMGRNDESVPFACVERTWNTWQESGKLADGSRFVEIAGGDHGLTASAETIARGIIAACADPSSSPQS